MADIQVADLLKSLPENINDIIKPGAEHSADRLAVVETTGSLTYGQLDKLLRSLGFLSS